MKIILRWLILAAAVYATPFVVPGITVATILTAIIVAACLAFINLTIKPVIQILTLPINIITLGLFSLIINGLFFWLLAKLINGFDVTNFTAAVIGALIVSIINWLGSKIIRD